ncbi:hypothetical protein Tco_1522785 [Tanacetum coccineum]
MAVIEDCWFQAMQDEIHEFDHLEVWELVSRPIYVMVIALKWIYKVKLDEYGDVLKNKVYDHLTNGYKTAFLKSDLQEEVFAPRAWYDILSKFLLANNFFKGAVDPTLFTRKSEMNSKFQMSMMGQMSFFLGLQVFRKVLEASLLTKAKYALETLKKYGMDLSDPVDTPMVDRLKLDEDLKGDSS